jgi:hypothetical protein
MDTSKAVFAMFRTDAEVVDAERELRRSNSTLKIATSYKAERLLRPDFRVDLYSSVKEGALFGAMLGLLYAMVGIAFFDKLPSFDSVPIHSVEGVLVYGFLGLTLGAGLAILFGGHAERVAGHFVKYLKEGGTLIVIPFHSRSEREFLTELLSKAGAFEILAAPVVDVIPLIPHIWHRARENPSERKKHDHDDDAKRDVRNNSSWSGVFRTP